MMQPRQRLGRRFRDLLDIIHIAENVSVKLHDVLDETAIFQTVADEFARSKKYSGSILMLTEDRSKLRIVATSLLSSPAHGPVIERWLGSPLLGYEMALEPSAIWRPVIEERRTVHCKAAETVRALFPPPIASSIIEAMDYERKSFVLAPLTRQGCVMGVLAMSSAALTEYLVPSVTNLALHISHALELVEARRKQEQAMQALQESQATLQTLINASPEVMLLVDRDYKLLLGNNALAQSLGKPLHELMGRNILEFFPPGVRETRERWAQEAWRSGKPVHYEDERTGRYFEHFVYPVFGSTGAIEQLAIFVRDITERRKMEAELLRSERLAAMGLLSEGVAHGLRNPLAVISSCVETVLAHPEDAALCTESARRAGTAVKRAEAIADGLLRFAHPAAGPMSALDLASVLRATLELLWDHLLMHKVRVWKRWPAELPLVYGNAQLLQQVFTELLLNACDAMPDGGTITITVRRRRGDWVEVCFRDTGQGIAPEHLPHIFEPLFTTKPEGEGIGIGLSIAQRIIQQHGGSIQVQSELGKGSVFTVLLRRAQ